MKTAVITGGAGFIGSHVAARLVRDGYSVVVFDDLSSGRKAAIPKRARFVRGDVRSQKAVMGVVAKFRPSVVCHIAGRASNIGSYMDPYGDIAVNYIGSVNIATACIRYAVPRLIYASSMLAHGADGPSSYYGVSKYAAERFLHLTAQRGDIASPFAVTSLRMFNVFGPGQSLTNPYQGVLAIFVGRVLRGEEVTIFGTGRQSRDFVFIDDVCDVWSRVIENTKSWGKVLDVGTGKPTSIKKLAYDVIRAAGGDRRTYPITFMSQRPGDIAGSVADMKKTRAVIGKWNPTALSHGLTKTIAWARKTL